MHKRVLIIAAGILFAAVSLAFVERSRGLEQEKYIRNRAELLSARIEATRQNLSRVSGYVFSKDIAVPAITSLMARAVRGGAEERDAARGALRRMLDSTYRTLLEYDFRQLHFQLPDNTSFLRMHSPDNYGDDLTGIRHTVETANAKLVPVAAFEEGRIYNGYRFVYPLFHEGVHCGSAEVSFSMESYIKMLEELDLSDYFFGIRRDIVETTVFEADKTRYVKSDFSPAYMYDREVTPRADHGPLFRDNAAKLEAALAGDADTGFLASCEGEMMLVLVHPIRNLNGRAVACILSVSLDPMIERTDGNYRLVMAIIAAGALLLTGAAYVLALERDKLKRLSTTDPLTGLCNRMAISGAIGHELIRAKRYKRAFSVLLIDLDHFKKINDRFGHGEGDAVLRNLAETMRRNMRAVDRIGRWGGEEFIVVLPDTALEAAIFAAEKLRKAIEQTKLSEFAAVTASIGVAGCDAAEEDGIDHLIAKADAALYLAKERGRNRVEAQAPAC